MSELKIKPLNWTPDPNVGLTVSRRPDGGMNLVFTDASHETLMSWRDFALAHLINADRLTRNLYDIRQIEEIPEEAIRLAVEANSDPAARNIRLAVVVASQAVKDSIREIAALTPTQVSAEIRIFTDIDEAETWLSQPLASMV